MKHLYTLRFLLAGPLALLALLAAAPAVAQVVVGRAAPTVEARKQVLRDALHLAPNTDLRPTATEPDPLGFVHEQYQVYYQGVKVEHGLLRVHSRAGKVESISGETLQPAAGLAVQPRLSEAAALQRALAVVGARTYKWQLPAEEAVLQQQTGKPTATYQPEGELVLVGDFRQPEAGRPLVLAWKFNIYAHEPVSRAWYYVDAQTGQVVLRDAIIKHANAPGATFATRYVGTRTSITDNTGSGYRLRETATSRGVTTLNVRKGNTFSAAVDFVDNDNNWTAAEHNNANFDNAALDAHLGAQATQGYWASVHGRDSYDDRGSVLLSYVHYDETPTSTAGTDNAYWNGTAMLYGDGNTLFRPLTAIDVCGHEIGHAVCEATANLVYSNESGALNEGFSDIWGACVENYFDPAKQVYLIGEDITLPSFGLALRSMSNPNQFGQPDTYKGTNWYTGTADDGGVHTNSGVLNYWFYLLSAGGAGTNDFGTSFSVTGISIAKAERIAYRAERFYMTPSTNYLAARQATLQAAIDLFGLGSAEATATAQAWRAVGVGTATGALEGAPTLTGFAPTSGPTGTEVTLSGTNLGATYKVTFNGVDARIATLSTGTTVTVTVPGTATTGIISLTTPSGTVTTSTLTPANFTVNSPGLAPTITGYLPAAGQVQGGSVSISGTNFTGATAVKFNGTAAVFAVVNATTITATVPAGATSGALTVTTPSGTATAPTTFLVLPAITSFSPTSATVGTTVTITGTSFTGAVNVKFNGVYATAFAVVNATTITATVPNGATTGPITVRTPSGTATSPTNFTVTASLAITSFSPTTGIVGTVVNIQGRGFTGTSAITFGGVNAPTYTVASDLEIWATVPTGAPTGSIVLTTPLGTATSPSVFTVDPGLPIISSFTPTSGAVGTAVTLTGNYFTGTTAVRFNGTAATFTAVNSTTINTTVPAGATTGPISVTNAVGTGTSAASFNLPPGNDLCANALPLACGGTVTGTTVGVTNTGDPTVACGGRTPSTSGGVFYQITGTGTSITLTACTGTTYDMVLFVYTGSCGAYTCVASDDDGCGVTTGGPSTLTFASTAGTPYLVYVTGFNTAKGPFTLTATCGAPPTISSFTPTSGAGGTAVSITGTNFTGATAVRFAGVAAAGFSVTNATTISATAPAGVVTGPISVVTPGGTATSATDFVGPPTVSSFTPVVGLAGTSVTVSGTGFVGVTAVRFNGTAATTFAVTNSTTLTATVPAGATTGPISVVNAAGTGTSAAPYTVALPLLVSALSPTRNARAAARTTNVGITFNQNVNAATAGTVRAYSPQRGGQVVRGGNATASAAVLTVNPATDLKPGETVLVTVPAAVTSSSTGLGAKPQVYQFTAAAGGSGTGSFQPGSDFTTGTTPTGIAAADVDGDGDLDLLTANFNASTVSVRYNDGTGAYSGSQTVPVGSQPYDVVMADVDGDGDLDFLATNSGSNTVSVRLNGGDATGSNTGLFGNGSTVSVGTAPFNTAVGDVDGDGDLDFLTANYSTTAATVSVRLNNGTGTFAAGSTVSVGNGGGYVAVGDVDGDGDLDLLTANFNANTVSVRLNGGDATGSNTGTFSGGSNPAVGTGPYAVQLGDVDADGDLDFISANFTGNTVSVQLNNGTGTFAAGSTVSVGTGPSYAGLADVDADGDLDIVTANFGTGANTASVRLNGGTGTFTGSTNVAVGTKPYSVALGDVDGDGDLDLLAAISDDGGSTGGGASVRFNRGPAPVISSFSPTSGVAGTPVTLTGTNLGAATSLTVNGVSTTPTVVNGTSLTFTVPAGCSATQSITVGAPDGSSAANATFAVRLAVASTSPAANARSAPRTSSAVGLTFSEPVSSASVTTAASQVKVYSAQAGGRKAGTWTGGGGSTIGYTSSLPGSRANFQPGEVVNVTVPATLATATGLAARPRVYQFVAATSGQGRGAFPDGSNIAVGANPAGVAVGDVDGDGDLDLVSVNSGNFSVSVRLNGGDATGSNTGTFGNGTDVSVGGSPASIVLGDVDGDGDLDILTANSGSNTVSVLLNGGNATGSNTGVFSGGSTASGTNQATDLALGDLDGDGDLDLVIVNGGTSTVSVRLNGGDATGSNTGTFSNGSNPTVGNNPASVAVGDVDNDGDLDLLVSAGTIISSVGVLLNGGDATGSNTGIFAAGASVGVGQLARGLAVGDVNGDGALDFVTANGISTGTVSVALNTGTGGFNAPATVTVGNTPNDVALADVDADGDLDLLAANFGSNTVSVRLNGGNANGTNTGVFSNGTDPAVGNSPLGVAAGDLDGDGDLDLLAANSGSNTVSVRLNLNTAPLPVELTAFTATAKAPNVQLHWRTASEKNSARFEVERSLNGQQFDRIGEVAGQGTKTSATDYAYLDSPLPQAGTSQAPIYYRLRQVDLDGTAAFSPVRAVTLSGKQPLTLYPNPARETVTVGGTAAGAPVEVCDALGRVVAAATADAAGTAQLALPAGLAAGVYVVRSGPSTLRLLVE
ncbi:FG-GAP-like repeat-containing protein [Hymenobacter sp. 5317J-9]|uniref:FG-GAP-like repeat-containing protein n=1 Tax=Hymenobacter sp. 5317J-9 TaxID=2932250 RepID=UPI001FD6BAB4|nr:FG-GAP-like repeat-containing protein [Hymenobacter sp. 5317J-9]UOQ98714.1 FG-GAP-like repeat-containing protein [Hymenobacter sp. 5317J-9]